MIEDQKNPRSGRELTCFTQIGGDVRDDSSGSVLTLTKPLEGRGQPGLAGFFGEWLIKVDDSATCLMEGSAGFAQSVIPSGYKSSVNFAHAGTLNSKNGKEAISIQKKAEGYKPWDEVIYGCKRNPKTPVSYEWMYHNDILKNIDNMHDNARHQLALAIFISTLVGDESIHTGQFMAKVDSSGHVTDIMRIDFGARERFALQRLETKDFKHGTSDAYKSSGQFGKDYIYYLLVHPDINQKYLKLWAREMNIEALGEKTQKEFIQQTNHIPQEKLSEALEGVWKTLSLKSSEIKPEPLTPEAIGNILKNIVITRATAMHLSAIKEINNKVPDAPNKAENKRFGDRIKYLIVNNSAASVMLFDPADGKEGYKTVSFKNEDDAKKFSLHFSGIPCTVNVSVGIKFYAFAIPKMQLEEKLTLLLIFSDVKEILNSASHQCNVAEIKCIEVAGEPIRYQFFLSNDLSVVKVFTDAIARLGILSESHGKPKECYQVNGNPNQVNMMFTERQFIQLHNKLWPDLNLPVPPVNGVSISKFGESQQFFTSSRPSMLDVGQQFLVVFEKQNFNSPHIVDDFISALSGPAMDSSTKQQIIKGALDIVEQKYKNQHFLAAKSVHTEKLLNAYLAVVKPVNNIQNSRVG